MTAAASVSRSSAVRDATADAINRGGADNIGGVAPGWNGDTTPPASDGSRRLPTSSEGG